MPPPDRYQALNDELLDCLTQCAEGRPEAFSRIYDLTSPKFSAILMKMVGNEAECADILQDAYLSIWKAAHRYDPSKGKPFTWMLVITRNRALDKIRKRTRDRETQTLSGHLIETLQDESRNPHEDMQGQMLRDLLVPYLSDLKPEVAKAILLSSIDGLSAREIGEELDVPTNTVKSWIRRGLKSIRKDLENSPDRDKLHKLID